MSGLAGVLAGRRPAGVYRWASVVPVADVRHAVEVAGWRFVRLDTARVDDESGFCDEARAAYAFPDSSSTGVDSLADALSGVRHDHGTVTLWEGWSPFARTQPQQFAGVIDVLTRRADTGTGGVFVVLLRGDGPPLDIAELDPHRT
ncbi:MAG: barstar family protein [Nocardioidaceae bacterium]